MAAAHQINTSPPRTPVNARMLANAGWTFFGNGLYSASQWLMVVVLARVTSPGTVGTLALALAITAPVMLFSNMQLRAVLSTDVNSSHGLSDYIYTRLVTTVVAAAGIMIFVLPFSKGAETIGVIIFITLSKTAENMSDILYGYWQLIERMEVVGKSLLIRGALTVSAFAASVTITRSLLWGAASLLAGSVGVLLIYDLRQLKRIAGPWQPAKPAGLVSGSFRWRTVFSLVRLSVPLGISSMLISLNNSIPRYFIEAFKGKHDLGIFSALSYFIIAGNLAINAAGQSALPRLARLYLLPEPRPFRRLLGMLLVMSAALGGVSLLGAALYGPWLLSIYGSEYADSHGIFMILMGVASTGYFIVILNYALNAIGAYKAQVPLFSAITAFLVVACRITVPKYGILGASLSLLAAGVIQIMASAVVLGLKSKLHQEF